LTDLLELALSWRSSFVRIPLNVSAREMMGDARLERSSPLVHRRGDNSFTERARRFIFFAQSATKCGSQTIETEHFPLGILHEDPDIIWRFLPSKTAKEIRAEVEGRLIKNTRKPPRLLGLLLRLRPVYARIDVPLSLPGKRIIGYGAEEAEKVAPLHHRRVNLEHILVGVVARRTARRVRLSARQA
jgi:hypothetical protein